MRLLNIELRNYRGVEHCTVEFAAAGVTIVQGRNEIGKSSLAEAIDRVLDDMDSSSRRRVQAVKPVGRDVGPEVAIGVETGPYKFRYRKRFLRDRMTELDVIDPKPEHHTGREAHERVLAILAETVDLPLWKALRIQQGERIDQAALVDQTSLSAALDRAAGEAPVGEDEMSLFGLAHDEYLKYWTETGRRKQEDVALDRSFDEAEQAIAAVDESILAVEDDVDAVARLDIDSKRLAERRNEQRETVRIHGDRVGSLSKLEGGVETVRAQFDGAHLVADQARRAVEARGAAIASVNDAAGLVKTSESEMADVAPAIEAARARLAESEERLTTSRSSRNDAKVRAARCQADLSRLRNDQEVAQLRRRLDRVTSASKKIQEASEAAAVPIDQALLDALRAQHRGVEIARARLAVGQPKVEVRATTDLRLMFGDETIELAAGQEWERRVGGRLEVTIEDVVTVLVSSGANDGSAQDLAQAEHALAEWFGQAGVTNLDEAERLQKEKTEAEHVIAEQERIRAENLDSLTSESLEASLVALRAPIGDEDAAGSLVVAADDEAIRVATAEADSDLEAEEQFLREAEQEAEGASDRAKELQETNRGRETDLLIARAELERREAVLATARAAMTDAEIDGQLAAVENAEQELREKLDDAETELDRQGLVQARDALENANQVLARIDLEVREVEDELIEVRTRLRDHGEDGLAEDRDAAVGALGHLLAERDRYKSRAAARKLLFDMLRVERDASRKAYVAPLRRQIENLGRYVFGTDFAVELDDQDLRVLSRTVLGRTVPFESLSVGAKEQIGLIEILACATIVAPDGGVPVILDDALGNSDPQRLESMGAVLAIAGKLCQIIIMTSQPDRYRHVGNASVVRLS